VETATENKLMYTLTVHVCSQRERGGVQLEPDICEKYIPVVVAAGDSPGAALDAALRVEEASHGEGISVKFVSFSRDVDAADVIVL
jgi:hypothetical protein